MSHVWQLQKRVFGYNSRRWIIRHVSPVESPLACCKELRDVSGAVCRHNELELGRFAKEDQGGIGNLQRQRLYFYVGWIDQSQVAWVKLHSRESFIWWHWKPNSLLPDQHQPTNIQKEFPSLDAVRELPLQCDCKQVPSSKNAINISMHYKWLSHLHQSRGQWCPLTAMSKGRGQCAAKGKNYEKGRSGKGLGLKCE